jgi:hypothetical protein
MRRNEEQQGGDRETRRASRQGSGVTLPEKRLNRPQAAAYVVAGYGFRLSPRTLEYAAIPYIVVNGQAVYLKADLDKWAEGKIANASRRIGRAAHARGAAAA